MNKHMMYLGCRVKKGIAVYVTQQALEVSERGIVTPSRKATVKMVLPPFLKGVYSKKKKNLLPLGANSFLLEWTRFQKETDVQESKQEVTKVVSLLKYDQVYPFTLTGALADQGFHFAF